MVLRPPRWYPGNLPLELSSSKQLCVYGDPSDTGHNGKKFRGIFLLLSVSPRQADLLYCQGMGDVPESSDPNCEQNYGEQHFK